MNEDGGKKFYKRYFRSATICDILNLLSLPICSSCMNNPDNASKINYIKSPIPMRVRKQGKEGEHAHYKSDFRNFCYFCNTQKLTEGFAMGIPDFNNMIEMLTNAIVHDRK